MCSVASFRAWPQFEAEATSVLEDVDNLLPEARDVLSFYLHTPGSCHLNNDDDEDSDTLTSLSDDSNYQSSSCKSTRHLPYASTLEAAEILLAALTDSPLSQQQVVRSPIVPSELGLHCLPSFGAPQSVTAVVPSLAIYAAQESELQNSSPVICKDTFERDDISTAPERSSLTKSTFSSSSSLASPLLPSSTSSSLSPQTPPMLLSSSFSKVLPLVSVVSVQPTTPLLPESTKSSSPYAVAAALTDCFADARLANPALNDLVSLQAVMNAITQAITAALLSQSGVAAVTNGTHALALRVDRIEDVPSRRSSKFGDVTQRSEIPKDASYITTDKRKQFQSNNRSKNSNRGSKRECNRPGIMVWVSRIFEMDWRNSDRAGPAHAIVAAIRAGLRCKLGNQSRPSLVRECVLRVGNAQPEVVFDDGPPWTVFSSVLAGSILSNNFIPTDFYFTPSNRNLISNSSDYKSTKQHSSFEVVRNDCDSANSLISEVIQGHEGVLARGASSIVLRSSVLMKRPAGFESCQDYRTNKLELEEANDFETYTSSGSDNVKVAVKVWNDVHIDGLCDLLHDISVFRSLYDRAPLLLGIAVPRVIAWRTSPTRNAALVTELVGKAVRLEKNSLLVGDEDEGEHRMERVVGADARALIDAARRSLRLLHEVGIAHGDVALHSLRVQRDSNRIGRWRAWWVDLSHAFDDVDAPDFDMCRFEIERVEKLLSSSDI